MLVHLGVALIVIGAASCLLYFIEYPSESFFAPGAFISAMGLILSLVGFNKNINRQTDYDPSLEVLGSRSSLSYLENERRGRQDQGKSTSGNRAFGFVLVSMGIFVLGISGIFDFFFVWPITLVGAGCLLGGVILRYGK